MIDGEIKDGKVRRFYVYNMNLPSEEAEEALSRRIILIKLIKKPAFCLLSWFFYLLTHNNEKNIFIFFTFYHYIFL